MIFFLALDVPDKFICSKLLTNSLIQGKKLMTHVSLPQY